MVYAKNSHCDLFFGGVGGVGCEKFLPSAIASMFFIGILKEWHLIDSHSGDDLWWLIDWWKSKLIIQPRCPGTGLASWCCHWHQACGVTEWPSGSLPWLHDGCHTWRWKPWEWSWIGSGVGMLKACITDIFNDMLAVDSAIRWVVGFRLPSPIDEVCIYDHYHSDVIYHACYTYTTIFIIQYWQAFVLVGLSHQFGPALVPFFNAPLVDSWPLQEFFAARIWPSIRWWSLSSTNKIWTPGAGAFFFFPSLVGGGCLNMCLE